MTSVMDFQLTKLPQWIWRIFMGKKTLLLLYLLLNRQAQATREEPQREKENKFEDIEKGKEK